MMELRAKTGQVKGARMARRAVAAQSFTETVNQNIDPAIMEAAGGSFSTRIFPLFAGRLHRIVLGYDMPLDYLDKDKLSFILNVPDVMTEENQKAALTRVDLVSANKMNFPETPVEDYKDPKRKRAPGGAFSQNH